MKFLVLLAFLPLSLALRAQDVAAVLALLDLKQEGDRVQVTVAIRGGASCQGVQLERKTGNGDYAFIDSYPGICGGTAFTEYYYLTDSQPLAGTEVFYRVNLGQVGYSEPIRFLFVQLDDSGISLYPNPSSGLLNIYVQVPSDVFFQMEIHDASGTVVHREDFYSERHQIRLPSLRPGIYSLRVFTEKRTYSKSFLLD